MDTITFIASFSVISLMILLKAFDLKVKRINFLARVFERTDATLNRLINTLVLRFGYYKKVAQIFVFDFLPSLIYEGLVKMKDKVAERYYNSGNEFRGRRLLRNDGSVSSFLERLAEDRSVEKKV